MDVCPVFRRLVLARRPGDSCRSLPALGTDCGTGDIDYTPFDGFVTRPEFLRPNQRNDDDGERRRSFGKFLVWKCSLDVWVSLYVSDQNTMYIFFVK